MVASAYPSFPMPGEEDWELDFPETPNESHLHGEGWLPLTPEGKKGWDKKWAEPGKHARKGWTKADRFFLEDNRIGGADTRAFRRTLHQHEKSGAWFWENAEDVLPDV